MYNDKEGTGRKISAIIVAAGKGTRMNGKQNKLFMKIGGIPIIIRTLHAFEFCDYVNDIVLVASQHEIEAFQKLIDKYAIKKVKKYVVGGSTRQQSVYNGLIEIDDETKVVIIHDGARPFVTTANIVNTINAAFKYGAAITAVPVKDTIKTWDCVGYVKATLDRTTVISAQTPQAFRYNIILDAHKQAIKHMFIGTDDSVLVERIGHKVQVVEGSYRNIKITTPDDIAIAQKFVQGEKWVL